MMLLTVVRSTGQLVLPYGAPYQSNVRSADAVPARGGVPVQVLFLGDATDPLTGYPLPTTIATGSSIHLDCKEQNKFAEPFVLSMTITGVPDATTSYYTGFLNTNTTEVLALLNPNTDPNATQNLAVTLMAQLCWQEPNAALPIRSSIWPLTVQNTVRSGVEGPPASATPGYPGNDAVNAAIAQAATALQPLINTAVQTGTGAVLPGHCQLRDISGASGSTYLPTTPPDGTRVGVEIVATANGNTLSVTCATADSIRVAGNANQTLTMRLLGERIELIFFGGVWSVTSRVLPLSGLDARYPQTAILAGKIIFVGDSNTYGLGASSGGGPANGAPYGTTYPAQVMAKLGPGWTGVNLGLSGETAQSMVTAANNQATTYYDPAVAALVAVILGGTNELLHEPSTTAAQIYERIVLIHGYFRAQGFRTVACTLLSLGNGAYDTIRNAVNALIRANWRQFSNSLADLAANPLIGASGSSANPAYFLSDQTHINDAGASVATGIVYPAIQQAEFNIGPGVRSYTQTVTIGQEINGGITPSGKTATNSIAFLVPAGFHDLRLILNGRGSNNNSTERVLMQFNNDTNGSYDYLDTVHSGWVANNNGLPCALLTGAYNSPGPNFSGAASIVIPNYNNTAFGHQIIASGSAFDVNAGELLYRSGGGWRGTAAIYYLCLFLESGADFVAGTTATLIAE